MESIIMAKFEQSPSLMEKLADTGNSILINGQWKGENLLGCALMDVRDWLRNL